MYLYLSKDSKSLFVELFFPPQQENTTSANVFVTFEQNLRKEDKKKTHRAYDYQCIKLVTSNESMNFDSTYKGTKNRYLKDLRTNVLKLHNNGKLLMIQTQNGNGIFYHLVTLLDNEPGKIRGKYMFYDRNLFNEFSTRIHI